MHYMPILHICRDVFYVYCGFSTFIDIFLISDKFLSFKSERDKIGLTQIDAQLFENTYVNSKYVYKYSNVLNSS